MPDRYNIEIRRIREEDKNYAFKTNYEAFDKGNKSGTLREYWESDCQFPGGSFEVYVLIETKTKSLLGIIKIRDEFEGAKLRIPELENKPALYLSMLGMLLHKRSYHLGRVLLEYFFFIGKSKIKEHSLNDLTVYWKCPDDKEKIGYYESFGGKVIHKINEEHWGPRVVMSLLLDFDE